MSTFARNGFLAITAAAAEWGGGVYTILDSTVVQFTVMKCRMGVHDHC